MIANRLPPQSFVWKINGMLFPSPCLFLPVFPSLSHRHTHTHLSYTVSFHPMHLNFQTVNLGCDNSCLWRIPSLAAYKYDNNHNHLRRKKHCKCDFHNNSSRDTSSQKYMPKHKHKNTQVDWCWHILHRQTEPIRLVLWVVLCIQLLYIWIWILKLIKWRTHWGCQSWTICCRYQLHVAVHQHTETQKAIIKTKIASFCCSDVITIINRRNII